MEHTENPQYWFWHQGIVNNNIDSSVNMEDVSGTLSRLVKCLENLGGEGRGDEFG